MSDVTPLENCVGNAEMFPILRKWDFFNHAGVSPVPEVAAAAMRRFADQAAQDAYLETGWYAQIEKFRKQAGDFIHASAEEIAFIKNTGEGISIVAAGIDWKSGDRIITTGVEYPSNIYPWMDVSRRFGVELVLVPEETDAAGRRSVPLEKILQAADHPRSRLVSLSHVEFASGQRHDLAEIGRFCRQRGILLCVDAIQGLGIFPVDVAAMNIDYLAADGHKWLLGPEGAGIFYCRRELLEKTHPLSIGWANVIDAQNYGNYDYTLRPDAGRFECGSLSLPGLFALQASMSLLGGVGIDAISRRIRIITDRLISGLQAKGYQILSPRGEGQWSGIVSFASAVHDHKGIAHRLRHEEKIEIVVREGRLRCSPHFYNTEAQIDRLIDRLPGH